MSICLDINFYRNRILNMAEFTKTYCNLHPHELITNFCIKQQCLVGLCANCICTHTQSHVEKGTSPIYENIRTTCKKMQNRLQTIIEEFDDNKQRIMSICEKVQEKRQKLNQMIDMAKQQARDAIESLFEERRNKLLREIEAQQKQAGLHCENRLQSLLNTLSRESSALIYAIEDLNSRNFIESLPRIRTQTLSNAKILHEQVTQEIQQNQSFKTNINFHKPRLQNLIGIVNDLVTINFSVNERQAYIKAENNQLKSSRTSNRETEQYLRNLQKNSSITFRLQESGMKGQNVQSQINLFQQNRCNFQIQQKKTEENRQEKLYHPSLQPTHQNISFNQTQQMFKYPNFLSEVPRSSDFIIPLAPRNLQQNIGASRTHQEKVSLSKAFKVQENTQPNPYDTCKNQKITTLGKKLRKNGLKVLQTHQSETDYSRDQNQKGREILSRNNIV